MASLALSFNDVNFQPIKHNQQIWLTASELAKALGYAKTDAVTQIYERNKDEFTSEMTTTLNMSAKGDIETLNMSVSKKERNLMRNVRVFSLRGCHLITFFARTPVAKEFRKWVLDVLDKEVGQPVCKTHKSEREPLTNAVNMLVAKTKHLNYSDAYKLVHQRFNVKSIDEIPFDAIPVAVEYVHHLIALYSNADKKSNEPWNDRNVQFLMWYAPKLAKLIKDDIYPALSILRSEFSAQLIGYSQDLMSHANVLNSLALKHGTNTYDQLNNQPILTFEWYLKK